MPGLRRVLATALLTLYPVAGAAAQGAIDPNIAPRAAALEREGERHMAIDLLGRYLATAPDDGRAWLQLGRFYLHDARDWHARGHGGEPDGLLYLDFAATALEQSIRLAVDSGLIFRGIVEVERGLVALEAAGSARSAMSRRAEPCASAPRRTARQCLP
jgi:tetratricopeptide (TPR) repeat protein